MSAGPKAPARILNKALKNGEAITKIGAKSTSVYIVQSGRMIVNLSRDSVVELHQAQAPQCIGEEALFGAPCFTSAMVVEPGQVIEIPIEVAKTQLNGVNPSLNLILRGLYERLKNSSNELKTLKVARGALPCPPDYTAKVFGVIFHAARYVGRRNGDIVEANWDEFKDYALGVMKETEYRVRQALNILAKLGYVENYIDQDGLLQFKDMTQIEAFFDFYQNYHFKSGYESLLKTNDKITAITQAVLKISEKYAPDRMGLVHMPFKPAIDSLKEILGKTFEADQLFRLEQKGLIVKRVATQDGGILSFYKSEFEQMLLNWRVLREVELWNEKGYVDMRGYMSSRDSAAAAAVGQSIADRLAAWQPMALRGEAPKIRTEAPRPDEILCPVCMSTVTDEQTMCEVCDTDLTQVEAA